MDGSTAEIGPVVSLYRLIPQAPMPMRADRSALGVLPSSALQYCEAVTSASAFGWYVFSPLEFHVEWDGTELIWTVDGGARWSPLTEEHFPGFPATFDAKAPEDIRGYAPPFLSAGVVPGLLQVWTGLFIRTKPGWSIHVRAPANVSRSRHFESYEGIVETDRWLMPLFANVRITTTDRPVHFVRDRPLLQIQPLKRESYSEQHLRTFGFQDALDEFSDEQWDEYRRTVVTRARHRANLPGRYAVDVRKRGHQSSD